MEFFQTLATDVLFRLDQMTWVDALDILLVTASFYLLFWLVRRSQAALLLRGLLALALILLLTTLILPLPTFDLIVWVGILAILIATPITLQPELRRMLERIGRRVGWRLGGRQDLAEHVIPPLLRAVENMSATQTGALIVLEGSTSLQEIEKTGIRVDGRVTAEMVQTIFFNKTPLHDGAVLVRGERVVAASCVLPLTDRALPARRRLGTRHRAGVGASEVSDALVIIVSEETGTISVAQQGNLERGLDSAALRQKLVGFYTQTDINGNGSVRSLLEWRPEWPQRPHLRSLFTSLVYLALSFLLAFVAAGVVRAQADPITRSVMSNVPLRITDMPPETTLLQPLPDAVDVEFQTLTSVLPTLTQESFQATASLAGVGDGPTRVPVDVRTSSDRVLVLDVRPDIIDADVVPIVEETRAIAVELRQLEGLSTAYEVRGEPLVNPQNVVVTGPATSVARVEQVQATVSVANASTDIREMRPLRALDAQGQPVPGVTLQPEQAQVQVFIDRRQNARDVGIRAVTTGSPPEGYWLSSLSVEPSTVTVRGDPGVIATLDGFVDTDAVDLSQAVGEVHVNVPLMLPDGVQAVNGSEPITNVEVTAQVSARSGDLLLTLPIQVINEAPGAVVTLEPPELEVLLSGPLPTLNEISMNPNLVRVVIDASALEPGQTEEVTPEIILPQGITAQPIETLVRVTTEPEPPA